MRRRRATGGGGGRALAASVLAASALAASAAPGCNQLAGTDKFRVDAAATPPLEDTGACVTNAECIARAAGAPSLCRKRDHTCARIASAECAFFVGNVASDDAVIIGAIGPTSGTDVLLGQATQNALSLALQDFAAGGGLPPASPGGPPRPLALVGCDEAKDPVAAAKHLALDLGVPAIVGASASGLTTQIATEVTIGAKVLLLSPSATSVSLTTLPDDGLVWRTAPSDVQQSAALALLAAGVAAQARPATDGGVSVVVLYKSDNYGEGLFEDVARRLKPAEGGGLLAPGDRLVGFSYGNPDDLSETPNPAASYDAAVEQLVAAAPHLVLALGTTEVVTELLTRIDADRRLGGETKFLFPDGGYVPQLGAIVAANKSLHRRVLGTRPASSREAFKAFSARYAASFRDGTAADSVGAAAAFDAFYLLAFAIAALPPGAPVDGPAVAQGLTRLVPPGSPAGFDPGSISAVFGLLAQDGNVDVEGASGLLDFDATGEALSDILVWCPASDSAPVDSLPASSGLFLDPLTSELKGDPSIECASALPPLAPTRTLR